MITRTRHSVSFLSAIVTEELSIVNSFNLAWYRIARHVKKLRVMWVAGAASTCSCERWRRRAGGGAQPTPADDEVRSGAGQRDLRAAERRRTGLGLGPGRPSSVQHAHRALFPRECTSRSSGTDQRQSRPRNFAVSCMAHMMMMMMKLPI